MWYLLFLGVAGCWPVLLFRIWGRVVMLPSGARRCSLGLKTIAGFLFLFCFSFLASQIMCRFFGRAMKFTTTANGQCSFTGHAAPVVFLSCFDFIEYKKKMFLLCWWAFVHYHCLNKGWTWDLQGLRGLFLFYLPHRQLKTPKLIIIIIIIIT